MNMDSVGVMNLGHFLLFFSLIGFAAVIRSSGNASPSLVHILWGEKRCVTTLITAAKGLLSS